jgi:hypothetical protein
MYLFQKYDFTAFRKLCSPPPILKITLPILHLLGGYTQKPPNNTRIYLKNYLEFFGHRVCFVYPEIGAPKYGGLFCGDDS